MAAILQTHPVRSTRGIVLHGGEAFASTIDLSINEDKQSPFALSLSKGQQASTGSARTVS